MSNGRTQVEARFESLGQVVQKEIEAIIPFSARARAALVKLGEMTVLLGRAVKRAVQPPLALRSIVYQVEMLGVRSLSIASLTAIFAGLVISLEFGFFMARFGVQYTVGKVVVLTLFRELACVLTALTVGGRIGSGIAAELGSMAVTEQVDAIRALGADPIKKLVVPRVIACFLVIPALTILADVFGLVAGAAVVRVEFKMGFDEFFRSAMETATWRDFCAGVGKAAAFGLIIGIVGCYRGLNVTGGTEGVGRATTETVAIASVSVLLADFFLTKLLLAI